jgi:cation:H+ antiporter
MMSQILIFAFALFMVMRGATYATRYAGGFAESLGLSKYTVGFLVIAIISILPETFISIDAAFKDIPAFGLGMLLGSNIADLTLVFVIIILFAGRNLKVEQKILKSHVLYPFILLVPFVLGFDGGFSRIEGLALIITGGIFYYISLKNEIKKNGYTPRLNGTYKNFFLLCGSLVLLLVGAHFTVLSATSIAHMLKVSPILIAMLVVGLGTTMPELFFSLKSVRKNDDSLAIGDILGTVLADATIVIGLIAVINPFMFPKTIIYIGGVFMIGAAFLLFNFMKSSHTITKKEIGALFIFWLTFVLVQTIVG